MSRNDRNRLASKLTSQKASYVLLAMLILPTALLIFAFYKQFLPSEYMDTNQAQPYTGTVYDPAIAIPDFTMPASTGADMSLSDFREQYVLIFFGFTHCPDVCPTTLATFRQVKTILGEDADKVAVLFISVDSPRDTPDVVAAYLRNFDPDFIGMSGDEETLQAIAPQFGLFYERHNNESETDYQVDHTGRSYVIDRDGNLRVSFAYGTDAEIIATGIRELMRQDGD